MSFDWAWPNNEDPTWDGCRRLAWDLFRAEGVLSHEADAHRLGDFVKARLDECPAGPLRDALLSVAAVEVQIATYLSCGDKAITHGLAVLLRLAAAWADHPDYDPAWRPA